MADELRRQLGRGGGAAVSVFHRGEPVVDLWGGEGWNADTLSLSFSTTKGVMATLVHVLADQGHLDYDAPVARYWPTFGKPHVTVRDLLCHRAGLHGIRGLIDHAERMLDWEHMIEALERAEPTAIPPGASAYHALTYGWLVGEVVRRVTGGSVREALEHYVSKPLGIEGLYVGAPEHVRAQIAAPVWPAQGKGSRVPFAVMRGVFRLMGLDPDAAVGAILPRGCIDVVSSPQVLDAEIPAMNGVFSARALARLYGALTEGELVSRETLRKATEVHVRKRDRVVGFNMRWRLGYHLVGTDRGVLPRAFGHFGYGGSGAWGDAERRLSVAMTIGRIAGTPFGDWRMVRISGIASRCAERF